MFWAHLIEDQEGCNRHADYIHWNPAKHGHTKNVIDLALFQFSSLFKTGYLYHRLGNDENYDIKGIE